MTKNRLETFTDAIIAIIMTLLVLEIVAPTEPTFAAFWALRYRLIIYILSFISLAIYWVSHHHLLQISSKIDGRILWHNVIFILCLSLFPFATSWVDENLMEIVPEVVYGVAVLLADIAYALLQRALIKANGPDSKVARALGGSKKPAITITIVLCGIALAFVFPPCTIICCASSMALWVIPEKRIEKIYEEL